MRQITGLGRRHHRSGRSPELSVGIDCAGHPGDRYFRPLKVSDDMAEYEGRIMWIDPAGRGKDEVGIAVVYHLKSQLFVKRCTGLMGGYSDANLTLIAKWAKQHKVERIFIEQNFGQGMFGQLLKPFLLQHAGGVTIEEIHSTGQKELRIIDSLEPIMSRHKRAHLQSELGIRRLAVRHHACRLLDVVGAGAALADSSPPHFHTRSL